MGLFLGNFFFYSLDGQLSHGHTGLKTSYDDLRWVIVDHRRPSWGESCIIVRRRTMFQPSGVFLQRRRSFWSCSKTWLRFPGLYVIARSSCNVVRCHMTSYDVIWHRTTSWDIFTCSNLEILVSWPSYDVVGWSYDFLWCRTMVVR